MNPTGGLLYDSQESAERAADNWRAEYMDLLDRLTVLNGSIDSLSLHNLIEQGRAVVRR